MLGYTHILLEAPPPRSTPPEAHTPSSRQTPSNQTPSRSPGRPAPADGYCSGRYASYWNVFLFTYVSCLFRYCFPRLGKVIWYFTLSVIGVYCVLQLLVERSHSTSTIDKEIHRFGNAHSRILPRDVYRNLLNGSNVSDRDKIAPNLVATDADSPRDLVNEHSPRKLGGSNHDNKKQALVHVSVSTI